MSHGSVIDLIDAALNDVATSNDAVRYNAPDWTMADPTVQHLELRLHARLHPPIIVTHVDIDECCSRLVNGMWDQLQADSARLARMRRLHTAYPRRWKRP